jgi:hypothetical protein
MISPRLSKGHRRAASVSVSPRPTVDTSKISRTWTLKIKGDPPADKTTHKSAEQSPALLSPPYNYLTLNMADFGSPIVTQQIAELNDIHVPAPIVMDNAALKSTSSAESPASSTICGHGQPMGLCLTSQLWLSNRLIVLQQMTTRPAPFLVPPVFLHRCL